MQKQDYKFWTDQIARNIVERKKFKYLDKKIPEFKKFTVKTSASVSGVLHIGRLSDTIRGEAVCRSLLERGVEANLIWVAEDMDPLRKIPEGVPSNFIEYIGVPVTDIPDSLGCHKSYAEHHVSKYFEVLDEFVSTKMKKLSMREEYKKGVFKPFIKKFIEKVDEVIEIQNKYRTTPLENGWSPWTPICKNCGKIITPRIIKLENGKVFYRCEDYSFEKNVAKGCGFEGEVNPLKDNGKLMWKSEWASQWAAWKIVSEGAGKEYQVPGSAFWINAELCEKILDFPSPVPIFYEYLIINGQKMSASVGNVIYPKDWLEVAPPELIRLLFLKDPTRVRDFRWDALPNLMDEYDDLEKVYYGIKKVGNERDEANLKSLFEIIQIKKIPKKYSAKTSYNTMVEIAKILPEKNHLEFTIKKLKELGLIKKISLEDKKEVEKRLRLAEAWYEKYGKKEVEEVKISEIEKGVIKILIEEIGKARNEEQLQKRIFEIAQENKIKPVKFFQLIYQILLKSDRGPRLGPYIMQVGKEEIIKKLKEVI
jgi:lysyl-tRNA synthetase class 1